jgi:hypothetical protein
MLLCSSYLPLGVPNWVPNMHYQVAPAPMRWVWKSCAMHKHEIFFSVLLQDKLNTRDLLERKNFHIESHECVLCTDNTNETFMHLFFQCTFSHEFWNLLHMQWDANDEIYDMISNGRGTNPIACFMEVLIMGCWSLWNHRNNVIFEGKTINLHVCFNFFKECFSLIRNRAKPNLK